MFWNICTAMSSSSGLFMIMLAGSESFRICLYLDQFVFAVILLAKCILSGLVSNSMSTGLWSEFSEFRTCRCSIVYAGLVYIWSGSIVWVMSGCVWAYCFVVVLFCV